MSECSRDFGQLTMATASELQRTLESAEGLNPLLTGHGLAADLELAIEGCHVVLKSDCRLVLY